MNWQHVAVLGVITWFLLLSHFFLEAAKDRLADRRRRSFDAHFRSLPIPTTDREADALDDLRRIEEMWRA